jgi:rhodanese-related sulfurtransferase
VNAPAHRTTIDELLEAARAQLRRVSAREAHAELGEGAVLVDIRSSDQRRRDGVVPGALWFPRNVLEWRVDQTSSSSHPAFADPGTRILLMCAEGYQTSLAACSLHAIGYRAATDVIDGFDGWRDAGLPFDETRDA